MRTPRRSPVIRNLALLGLCVWLVGCHKWVAMDEPYAETIRARQPSEIRITLEGTTRTETRPNGRGAPTSVVVGETLELRDAEVWGDSIRGVEGNGGGSIPMAIALDRVASVEERKSDPIATVGLTMGVLAGLVIVAVGFWALTCSPSAMFCPRD